MKIAAAPPRNRRARCFWITGVMKMSGEEAERDGRDPGEDLEHRLDDPAHPGEAYSLR